MILFVKYLLFLLLTLSVLGAAYFSAASRRAQSPEERGRKRAVMNMLLGTMLTLLALMSMFLFRGSTVSIAVEAVFLVLGAFNLFSGLRSYYYYSGLGKSGPQR
ncbi:hypothetical protein J2Z22_000683 [Paenibacillus forsythiae]|uniref:YtpI-like protein n=1 Tax=Paenibacillus forsythiae TaxID=365616 RepID=A0ABU3H2W9_9BACL|nr:YtpI family protein [Paenibacillus forsythiae]MDT3425170.1 hypothetical protein [Paenibacillus forsythiae]